MKQMTSGMLAFLGVLAMAGCYSYQGDAINNANYNEVQSTPNFVVVRVGDSDQMLVRLVNAANQGAVTSYAISSVGAGVAVHYQANYRPVFSSALDTLVPTGDKDVQQYYVVGVATGNYTFNVTPTSVNTGISGTVKVVVTPRDLGLALDKATPASGDVVTLTAPSGLVFSQTSAITFPTGAPVVIQSRSADSTKITFVVGPGVTGVATVTKVGLTYSPTVAPVTLSTTSTVTTGAIPATVSASSGLIGVPFTITLGSSLRWIANSQVFVGTDTSAIEAGIQSISADSLTATIMPMMGSNGVVNMSGIALSAAVTACNTLAANCAAAVTGISAVGPAYFTGNTASSYAVGATFGGATDATSLSTTTATTYGPAGGLQLFRSFIVSDAGAFAPGGTCTSIIGGFTRFSGAVAGLKSSVSCRYYKFVLPTSALTGELRWDKAVSTDLGLYTLASNFTATTVAGAAVADLSNANQAGGPELNQKASVTGATFFLVVVNFKATDPAFFQYRLHMP